MIWAGIIGVGLILIVVFVAVMIVTIINSVNKKADKRKSYDYSAEPSFSTWTITGMVDEFVIMAKKLYSVDRCQRGYGPIYYVYELQDGRILFVRHRYAASKMQSADWKYYDNLKEFLNSLDTIRHLGGYCEDDNCYFIRACKRKWNVKSKHQS